MLIYNSFLIHKELGSSNSKINDVNLKKSQTKKLKVTLSLLIISFYFLILTLPSGIFLGFIEIHLKRKIGNFKGPILDFFSFLNHSSLFYELYLSNFKF